MTIEFFNFSKKKNSTKQPTTGSGTQYTGVELKDDCSIINPVIKVRVAGIPVPTVAPVNTFNYAYIAKFQRYYFVSDWVYTPGIWEAHLTLDVMASHKTSIGAMSEYVVRSASASDGTIIDTYYPAKSSVSLTNHFKSMNFSTTGFYVIGVICNSSTISEGAITYYLLTAAELANIKSYLMSNTFLSDNNLYTNPDLSPDLIKVLYNPFQYIVSCKYYPFPIPLGDPVGAINFGWWFLNFPATRKVPEGGYMVTAIAEEYTVPAHPQAASRGTYMNHAPYTELVMYHPLFGTVPLDMSKIDAGDVIRTVVNCETITGQGYITIYVMKNPSSQSATQYVLYQALCSIAIDIPLAQMNIDTIQAARTAVNTVGNIVSSASRLDIGGVITATGNGVLDALQCTAPVLQSSGSPGNRASFVANINYWLMHRIVVNDDNANRGRPLCQVKQINTLSGYIKCADAHVDIPCLEAERDIISGFMESGFYYE